MKYLRKFNESKDEQDIHSICNKYGIENYIINDDGFIDVNDNVDLSRKRLSKLPLKFRNVAGYFYCDNNQLTSLLGAPRTVGGNFYCDNNKLTSLEGAPISVGGSFYCDNNQLTSLEGAPISVDGYFSCENNQLTSLEGSPRTVGGSFYCYNNPISKWWNQIDNKEKLEVFIDLNINSEDPDWINQEKIEYII